MAAGRTRISGTGYDVVSGRTIVDGTRYYIIGGETRVNGTAYTISFGIPIIFSGDFSMNYSYITVNGSKHVGGTVVFVNDNPTVKVYVSSSNTTYQSSCRVYLNNTVVKSGAGSYSFDVSSYNRVDVKFVKKTSNSYNYYYCYITTS